MHVRQVKARFYLLPVVFVVFVFVALVAAEDVRQWFDPERCHVVDYTLADENGQQNFLFRGSIPLVKPNRTFVALSELTAVMQEVAMVEVGQTVPKNMSIVDISWLYGLEHQDQQRQELFWKSHPTEGSYMHYPLHGTFVSPSKYSPAEQEDIAVGWTGHYWILPDDIPMVTLKLENLVRTLPRPTAIYYACEGGQDRTGMITAAYQMRWFHWSYAKALIQASHVAGRPIALQTQQELQWYCLHLKYTSYNGTFYDCSNPPGF
jgi:hypothetical protein